MRQGRRVKVRGELATTVRRDLSKPAPFLVRFDSGAEAWVYAKDLVSVPPEVPGWTFTGGELNEPRFARCGGVVLEGERLGRTLSIDVTPGDIIHDAPAVVVLWVLGAD